MVFHTLRHTACSWMVQKGIPDRQIMAVLGHGSAQMVSRYAYLAPKALDKHADALADMWAEVPESQVVPPVSREVGVAS